MSDLESLTQTRFTSVNFSEQKMEMPKIDREPVFQKNSTRVTSRTGNNVDREPVVNLTRVTSKSDHSTDGALEENIETLKNISGRSREDVVAALRYSNNNLDRAAEILITIK